MSLFSKSSTKEEMRICIKEFMFAYLDKYPESGDTVIPIFSQAEQMVKSLSEHDLQKSMRQNNVNSECGAFNILQNFAMQHIKPRPAYVFIGGEEIDWAYDLYLALNDFKFSKGYITSQQHKENADLALKLTLQSPFGSFGWL